MAPSAIDPRMSEPKSSEAVDELPPPHLYTVKEPRFESYKPPNPQGYHQAQRMQDGEAAIVIDNGKYIPENLYYISIPLNIVPN